MRTLHISYKEFKRVSDHYKQSVSLYDVDRECELVCFKTCIEDGINCQLEHQADQGGDGDVVAEMACFRKMRRDYVNCLTECF